MDDMNNIFHKGLCVESREWTKEATYREGMEITNIINISKRLESLLCEASMNPLVHEINALKVFIIYFQ